ncbi:transport and Golgi organization protein 6 homolog isoform X2 [Austrofundulus limnaeus]|uniref:Transport and Golgi organization protein 6 homolog isoform X2 n=1 Tax=Austrofundulus limnaeus TaxID=52670 RepID=A0A2I4BTT2_AUSLI|nr:PREDICTED: transport and Golgi organization protein 6 homolog isoform X2 [Austrofundulus limnaeus]
MTSEILSLINILIKPFGVEAAAQSSQQEALRAALGSNKSRLQLQLQSDGSLEEVRKRREEVKLAADWFCDETEDVTWSFVQECLLLLLTLTRHLTVELERFQQAPPPSAGRLHTSEMAPPLPPDVLSVSQQKTLAAALQFVVSLGLCPYLAPGVGVPLGRRSAFGAVVETLVNKEAWPPVERRLLITTRVLLQLAELSSVAMLVFTRHLGDVMAALCQLGHQPHRDAHRLSSEESRACKDALRNLLGKVYQPMVIKELLILQGGPKQVQQSGPRGSSSRAGLGPAPAWLRRLCGQLLSECLMQPNGVQAVVRAVLEGGAGGDSDWRKCEAVGRILSACPQQAASGDQYFKLVCPQVLHLLHLQDKLTAQQFQQVATRAVLSMVQERPGLARQYLLDPLLSPLQRCVHSSSAAVGSEVVLEESELTRCLDDVFKIWVVGASPSVTLLTALEEVLPVVFTLFCFTKRSVSHLRAPCQEVLLWFLNHSESSAALSMLQQLSGLKQRRNDVADDFQFSAGSDGGVRLVLRQSCRDEDDQLYEKLSAEQWRLECLMQLLAEVKESDLPGDFFLHLLKDLTTWTAAADEEMRRDEEQMNVAAVTLLEAEHCLLGGAERRAQRLALLQVVAVMTECLQHTQLLRKTSQVVDFMVSLLQRACVGLDVASGPGLGNPVETQTLSMGMGLVATLLSGPQIRAEDYSCMSGLLPPLQTLALQHPDPLVQELASNLRAVIATHGAYRPQDLAAAGAGLGSRDPGGSSKLQREGNISQTPVSTNSRHPEPCQSPGPQGDPDSSSKSLSDWLLEACDPDVPTRAFAMRILTQKVQRKDPEAVQAQEKVLLLLLENLEHEDPFVYLSAIQGLAVLADSHPDQILERLLRDFRLGPSLPSSNKQRSLETRLKVGEVLMRASRAMGELAPHHGRPLLSVFLQGTKDPDQSVRASSLSNLGELCQRLDFALGPLTQELSSCLTALIKTEQEAEVRRAAVHVITLLLRGLSDRTTQVLDEVLLDLYRALKWVVRSDPDQVAVLHAQLALEELDDIMRRFMFPQQKLEKKIVVLP